MLARLLKGLEGHDYRQALQPCPACGPGRRQVYLEKICRLRGDMLDWSLDGFWPRNGRGDGPRRAALDILDRGRGWLAFWGKPGVGKTYLLAAIVNEARKHGVPAVYTTMAELLDDFRATFNPESPIPFATLWQAVTTAQVLAVDELEKYNTTSWAEERFFMLIEKRYREADKLLTVFATNKHIKRGFMMMEDSYAAGYLESRLTDGRFAVVEVGGGDVRPGLRRSERRRNG